MEVFYIAVLLSHNTYYGSFYMLVMFGKYKKDFWKDVPVNFCVSKYNNENP